MQSLHRAFLVGLRRGTLVFLGISRVPPDRRFGALGAHAPQNDHGLAGLQVRYRGAKRMSRIACFSSWDHAGRRSRRGRREFGSSRPSPWSFCQWDRVRRETPTILAAASADTSCRRVSPTTGSARTGGLPHRGGDSISPGTPPESPARICGTRAVEPDGTGGMVSLGVPSSIGSGTCRMRTYTPSGRVSPFLRRPSSELARLTKNVKCPDCVWWLAKRCFSIRIVPGWVHGIALTPCDSIGCVWRF